VQGDTHSSIGSLSYSVTYFELFLEPLSFREIVCERLFSEIAQELDLFAQILAACDLHQSIINQWVGHQIRLLFWSYRRAYNDRMLLLLNNWLLATLFQNLLDRSWWWLKLLVLEIKPEIVSPDTFL
jgi:hypothetical protein